MNKEIAKELDAECKNVAQRFSRPDREGNFNKETFEVDEIISMSDHTATVVFKKSSGKLAAAFFYYIQGDIQKVGSIFSQPIPTLMVLHHFIILNLKLSERTMIKTFS